MAPVLVEFTLDYFLSLSIPDGENVKDSFVYKTLMESVGDEGVTEGNFFYTLMSKKRSFSLYLDTICTKTKS